MKETNPEGFIWNYMQYVWWIICRANAWNTDDSLVYRKAMKGMHLGALKRGF